MARPREFDEEQALDRATDVFWAQGYKRTSLEDLLTAMGIQKGSFYNTFGSKRALYLRCLERYGKNAMTADGPFGEMLTAIRQGPAAIRQVCQKQLSGLANGDHHCGCFVASASHENRGQEDDVLGVTRASVETARDALTHAVETAQAEGAMPPGIDARVLATMFMTMGYGSHLLAVTGVAPDTILSGMDAMFGLMATGPEAPAPG